jgi:antibiotic biosynthesis monooxygenase (ABM) superfamily enzyme
MSEGSPDAPIVGDTPVTTIIRQQPLPGSIERYEAWLKEIIPIAQSFAGHQSVNIIRPRDARDAYTVILHFDTNSHLRQWLDSNVRAALVEKIRPDLQEPEAIDIKTGFEFWFTPPVAGTTAKPYKQFMVTLSAIFPLTILVPWALQPLFNWVPVLGLPGLRHLVVATIIVTLMAYVVMPHYTRAICSSMACRVCSVSSNRTGRPVFFSRTVARSSA